MPSAINIDVNNLVSVHLKRDPVQPGISLELKDSNGYRIDVTASSKQQMKVMLEQMATVAGIDMDHGSTEGVAQTRGLGEDTVDTLATGAIEYLAHLEEDVLPFQDDEANERTREEFEEVSEAINDWSQWHRQRLHNNTGQTEQPEQPQAYEMANGAHGIYVWQELADTFDLTKWGISAEDAQYIASTDPNEDGSYWITVEKMQNTAKLTDEAGTRWQIEQDNGGNIWATPAPEMQTDQTTDTAQRARGFERLWRAAPRDYRGALEDGTLTLLGHAKYNNNATVLHTQQSMSDEELFGRLAELNKHENYEHETTQGTAPSM